MLLGEVDCSSDNYSIVDFQVKWSKSGNKDVQRMNYYIFTCFRFLKTSLKEMEIRFRS